MLDCIKNNELLNYHVVLLRKNEYSQNLYFVIY
jgi:hypothetical protein